MFFMKNQNLMNLIYQTIQVMTNLCNLKFISGWRVLGNGGWTYLGVMLCEMNHTYLDLRLMFVCL